MSRESSEPITVSRADLHDPRDAAALRAIFAEYAEEEGMLGRPMSESEHQGMLQGVRARTDSLVLIARLGDLPAGMAVCFEGFSTFRAKPLLNIHDIAVRRDLRGRGVGKHLLNAIEDEARNRGCCAVTLDVAGWNDTARRLYQQSGYRTGEPPTVFMTKSL